MKINLFLIFLILTSCKIDYKNEEEIQSNPIAKVENKFLYKEDLIQFENNSDSIKIIVYYYAIRMAYWKPKMILMIIMEKKDLKALFHPLN